MDYEGMGNDLGGILGQFFSGANPSGAYNEWADKIPGMLKKYYGPYMQEGQQDQRMLHDQFTNMMNDPGGLLAKFGQGYKASPGYNYQVQQAQGAANRASAAGGMLGSPAEQQAVAGRVGDLANQDYNQYLSHVMGVYGHGLGGLGHFEDQGYGATQGMIGGLGDYYGAKAKAAEEAEREKQQHSAGLGSFLGDVAGGVAGFFL